MIIDLHLHTNALSSDSSIDPEDAVIEAKRVGLDGICFTEHNRVWRADDVARISSKLDFPVLRGIEVDTVEGHVLVFGLYRDFDGIIRLPELRQWVDEVGGVIIAAHPLKGFRAFGVAELQLTPEQASKRKIFHEVDAVECFSGRSTDAENRLTQNAAEMLNLEAVGGSDAHVLDDIGNCVTIFDNRIMSDVDLIRELKEGNFRGAYLRRCEEET